MELQGRKAIVFGGTSGIGLATTTQLAAAGAEVVAVSRNPDRVGAVPDGVRLAACDVTDEQAVADLLAAEGPYHALVSAATGGARAVGPFTEMDMGGFQGSFAKLWGYANVVRHGAAHLSDDGSIVLVSGSPARRCKPGFSAIASVGAAVEHLVRSVAPEITPKRINVVSPGTIDTPMVPTEGEQRAQFYEQATANHLIPRAGTADEVAQGILFCLTNDFVTGTTVDVDGGWLLS
ncbi:MAG: SDR family oxidoreductase [Actinomycetota bacterium]